MSPSDDPLTVLFAQSLRLAARLRAEGDTLAQREGLSAARWQLLGMISDAPLTVAEIARRQETTRQGVQRLVNDMARDGLVTFRDNPVHKTSPLVMMTDAGRAVRDRLAVLQADWTADVGARLGRQGIGDTDLTEVARVLALVRRASV